MIWFAILFILLIITIFITYSFFNAKGNLDTIFYVNRKTGKKEQELVPGEFWLKWLYSTLLGKATLNAIIKRAITSKFYGFLMDSPSSAKKIIPFINSYNINMDEAVDNADSFKSFNEFFIRKLKPNARAVDKNFSSIISPADGKISVFENVLNIDSFFVKGEEFNIASFFGSISVGSNTFVHDFLDSSMAIIRLAPVDYHRFHFPVSGNILEIKKINGPLYSVSPLAVKENIKILFQNKREITITETAFGKKMAMCEVGATMVGSIVQTFGSKKEFSKGDKKGYFKFGGSTVILFFEKDTVDFDSDLINNTKKGFETSVKFGERIALSNSNL